jgi:lipoate synthase
MEPIPEAIVEKTWQEVAGFSPDRAKKEIMKIGNSQPELLAFVTESSKEMSQEVRELAIYMFLVVYRMFKQSHGKIQKISSEEIIECYENNEGLMERLEGADEKFLDRIASVQTSRQPHVVNYVVDALMEDDEGEDTEALTEEQKGFLFLLLKTVIDVLDQKGMKS